MDHQPRPTQVQEHLIQVDLQEVPLILAQEGRDPKVVHLTPEPEVFQEAHLIQALEGLRQQLELRVDHPTPELVIVVVFQEAPLIQELEVFQEAPPTQELEDLQAVTQVLHRQEANMEM